MNDKRTGANPYGDISHNVAARQESPGKKIAVIVVAAVVVLALVAVLATQCGKDSTPAGKNTGAAQAQNATQQTAAVSVTGTPLPPYPSDAGLVADAATDPDGARRAQNHRSWLRRHTPDRRRSGCAGTMRCSRGWRARGTAPRRPGHARRRRRCRAWQASPDRVTR